MSRKNPRDAAGRHNRLSDVAYTRVLEALFERRLPTGSFVSQADLVRLTGVPVGPLRDALRVLDTEGVVTIHPRTGIQFVKPGLELTRATYQFRGIIEQAAIAVFTETAKDAQLDSLAERHRAIESQVEREGVTDALLADIEALENALHGAIVASLNNGLIDASYRRIHNYLRILRLDRLLTPRFALQTTREHLLIIAACRRRNPAAAAAALQAHFDAALRRILGLVRSDAAGQSRG